MFSRFLLAACLFTATFAGFITGKKNWYFGDDDYGAFYCGKKATVEKFKDYFTGKYTNEMTIMPTNMKEVPKSFYSATYRPVTLVFYALECLLLNAKESFSAWPYFLVSIGLHSLSVAMVFWALSFLTGLMLAFFTALAFAFYPFMGRCVGPFSFQPFSISLIFGLICIGLFYRYLNTKNLLWLIPSCLAFAIPLFMHEIIILLPVFLFCLAIYFFLCQESGIFGSLVKSFIVSVPFLAVVAAYIFLRKTAFPVDLNQTAIFDPIKMINRFQTRAFDFVTLKVDLTGISWIPAGHRLAKSVGIMAVFAWYVVLYLLCSKRWPSTLMTIGFFCLAWPSYLVTHQARYLYLALPFFLGSIAISARYIVADNIMKFLFKWSVPVVFCAASLVGFFENRTLMNAVAYRQGLAKRSFHELANDPKLFDKSIFFVGLPHEIFPYGGAAQAIWSFGPKSQDGRPVIYESLLNSKCFFVHNVRDKIPTQNLLRINIDGPTVSVSSSDPEKIWIHTANSFGVKTQPSVGTMVKASIYHKGERAKKVVVKLSEKWSNQNLAFVTWDYEKSKFVSFEKEF